MLIQTGQGYGGPFVLGLRIMEDGKIHEVIPFNHKETPAFAKKIEDANYRAQFIGKNVADDFILGVDIDGVSGATSKEVSAMVVEGAAYTTYKLWNIVYGSTQDIVVHLTEKQLKPDLLDLILKSPDISDRIWALNRLDQSIPLTSNLTSSLLDIISGEDYFMAYSAINAIKPVHLESDYH